MAVLLVAVLSSTRGPGRKIHDINAIPWISARIEMSATAARHDPEKWKLVFRKRSCFIKYLELQSVQF
jgi:hypothetical protein